MANDTALDEADVELGDLRTRLCQNATGLWSHRLSNSGYRKFMQQRLVQENAPLGGKCPIFLAKDPPIAR